MAIATGAIITGVQELLNGTIKELVNEIKDSEGVTEQDAKDIVANILVDLGVNSATVFTVLKSGVAVKAAEYLGLTSRGFAKKALVYPASSAAARLATNGGKKVAVIVLKKLWGVVSNPVSLIWLFLGVTQFLEQGVYKPNQANSVYERYTGVRPFPDAITSATPGPFSTSSGTTFSDFARSLEAAGVKGIEDPVKRQSVLYDRETLAALIDYVYGQEILKGNAPSVSKLLPLISKYLVGAGTVSMPVSSGSSGSSYSPSTKVFTGIVSQGVVGEGLVFTPRPDDMIESANELREAAANNLSAYLATLLGKIVYEVKVVPSIITKEGFKQTGTTQRVQTGSYANGQPKYKYVTNKFATITVYALTDKGSRSKLTTIVLGPTDSTRLTAAQGDLRALEAELPGMVTTTDINDITGIATANPITVTTPEEALATPDFAADAAPEVPSAPSIPTSTPVSTGAGYGATTLSAWYQSQGQSLPSVSSRSKLYAELGLGNASYYTGTAEQNTRLLAALKKGAAPKAQQQKEKEEKEKKEKEEKEKDDRDDDDIPKVNFAFRKGETGAEWKKRIDKEIKAKDDAKKKKKDKDDKKKKKDKEKKKKKKKKK
jgi:hypothetical protein